ncbi:uncharacterized protein ARMOST_21083 [Armillaria ostoyae]|uniref:Uncharacterized protein n=1 Tax=Armillaria ostoyae TaxID=47428 RepID=A0A284S950_ARMOS|nr:uncharacterized protein ARMOST_21083 [Armillaria ostoyae]
MFSSDTEPSLFYVVRFRCMSSSPNKVLPEMGLQAWLDDWLNSYILSCFAHGVYTGIFGISMWILLAAKRISKARIYMTCIITTLYILSTISAIAWWIELSEAYVFGTSFQARYNSVGLRDSTVLLETIRGAATALNLIIADCTILWRCWVVWAHDWKAVTVPILFVIAEIVCGCILVVRQLKDYESETDWALATMAMTLGTNVLCTGLIIARIIHVARGHRGAMDAIRTYRGILETLMESAALYSIIYVVLMILYPLSDSNGFMYAQDLVYPITGIVPTLIVARVASGQTRPEEESSNGVSSSLHFQSLAGSTIETTTDEMEEDMIVCQGKPERNALITEPSGAELV